ncbi:RES domain-containing protein [Sphingomonas histidinilytica]|uniref:RES domain-containing protein n=1 Tax=Rhizorhabdus histidinilytica TaxID=439228 RepID=A0A1T5EIJ6_9SPHN|nr:RES family NAD+ phosphorylase [Rhizorhabdus histidinilytica]MBO9380618.1 RES domain-containing protein [Rhizorhabdus histidinilytica]SKB83550.1 RES domain-containing protein [Rhizorhabdus histidinilytica]
MSLSLWRIATDTKDYEADDLSGKGAEITGGRWNTVGIPMVYTSLTRALACLETIVHLNGGGLPLNRYLVEVRIADDLWSVAETQTASSLKVGWDAEPAGRASVEYGSDWARSNRSLLLIVPSVIVPEETNVLINPHHPEASRISATKVRRWLYDGRLKA